MKKILLILALGIMAGCTSNRYLLSDNSQDRKYLVNYIQELNKEGKMTDKPLVVLDGSVLGADGLRADSVSLSKADISKIDYLPRDNEKAINTYGEKGRNGVVMIFTKKYQASIQKKKAQSPSNSKVLYLVDGLKMTQDNVKKIDKNSIESISVVTDKNSIKTFTSGDYNQVVMIKLNKGGAN